MGLPRTYRYWLLLALSWLWLAAIIGSAAMADAGWTAGRLLHVLFSPVCHQLPERSFFWGTAAFGVCQRCFGVYAGFAAGVVLWPRLSNWRERLLAHSHILWLAVGLMVADVLLPNQPWDRFVTGILVGFPGALFVWLGAEQFPGTRARVHSTTEAEGWVPDAARVRPNQRSVQ